MSLLNTPRAHLSRFQSVLAGGAAGGGADERRASKTADDPATALAKLLRRGRVLAPSGREVALGARLRA